MQNNNLLSSYVKCTIWGFIANPFPYLLLNSLDLNTEFIEYDIFQYWPHPWLLHSTTSGRIVRCPGKGVKSGPTWAKSVCLSSSMALGKPRRAWCHDSIGDNRGHLSGGLLGLQGNCLKNPRSKYSWLLHKDYLTHHVEAIEVLEWAREYNFKGMKDKGCLLPSS